MYLKRRHGFYCVLARSTRTSAEKPNRALEKTTRTTNQEFIEKNVKKSNQSKTKTAYEYDQGYGTYTIRTPLLFIVNSSGVRNKSNSVNHGI